MELKTIWDFVERYYPDYSRCGDIAENDDLQKIVDGEINGEAEKIYNEIAEDLKPMFPHHSPEEREEYRMLILEQVQNKLNESNAYVFEKAIQGYIDQLKGEN